MTTQIHVEPKQPAVNAPVIVRLTADEMTKAAAVGAYRRIKSIVNRRNLNTSLKREEFDRWQADIEGALAEMAVVKVLRQPWTGSIPNGEFKGADVGDKVQVRSTRYADGCLILYPNDYDAHLYVLCVGAYGTYRLAGWVSGSAGKDARYWMGDGVKQWPAFFVPQKALRPIRELMEMLHVA